MRILGIDPGSVVCGYGVIEEASGKLRMVESGVIRAKLYAEDFNERLKEIYVRLASVVKRTKPDVAAFESPFYSKNVQSLIKLSHARAVSVLAAAMADLPIYEYSAREVKKSVTGNGAAAKESVQFMTIKILGIEDEREALYDASDALAVAICHYMKGGQTTAPAPKSKSKKGNAADWSQFIKDNPERVK
ncbi:MAG: crossover junction endodeoxyribonuclease RuvC [Chloroflexota bacterium]